MLVWGDLVFIPFVFSLQAWFLLTDQTRYSTPALIGIVSVFSLGYVIFRFSNRQKHEFKKNPKKLVFGRKPVVLGGKCKWCFGGVYR